MTVDNRENIMRVIQFDGRTNIFVLPDLQYVFISNVLSGKKPTLRCFDFLGEEIEAKQYKNKAGNSIEGKFSGEGIEFNEHIAYAHINSQIFTPDQVKAGAWFNFGNAEEPMIFKPFYACSQYTGGTLSDKIENLLQEILDSLPDKKLKENWKKIYVESKAGMFFVE